jgi:hypothetical protein
MVSETPPTFGQILDKSHPELQTVKRALEIAAPAIRNEGARGIVVLNCAFLTGPGRLSPDEYFSLLKRCVESDDFTDLAAMFCHHLKKLYEERLKTPDRPEYGDDFRPGRQNVLAALHSIESYERTIRGIKQKRGENPLCNIGTPALGDRPDWYLMMGQEGMTLEELFRFADEYYASRSPSHDSAVSEGTRSTAGRMLDVIANPEKR